MEYNIHNKYMSLFIRHSLISVIALNCETDLRLAVDIRTTVAAAEPVHTLGRRKRMHLHYSQVQTSAKVKKSDNRTYPLAVAVVAHIRIPSQTEVVVDENGTAGRFVSPRFLLHQVYLSQSSQSQSQEFHYLRSHRKRRRDLNFEIAASDTAAPAARSAQRTKTGSGPHH